MSRAPGAPGSASEAGASGGGRTGRRPGAPPTRDIILRAARELFAARGYERTTIRSVAAAAGVDPALVHHYFGSKDDLLTAALTPPVDVRERLPQVFAAGDGTLGERATRMFLTVWEDDELRPIYLAIVRCAGSHERAVAIMRRVLADSVLAPIVTALDLPDAPLRANLTASQFIGLAMVRYVTRLEPLASTDVDTLVSLVAPTVDRYLTGALDASRANEDVDKDGHGPSR